MVRSAVLTAASLVAAAGYAGHLPGASAHKVNLNSYAPVNVTCPDHSLLRNAGSTPSGNQTLNSQEALYIQNRKQGSVASAFQAFLADNKTGYDLSRLIPNASYWPTVGIAVSGGGFRAALVGAGTFQAFDSRNSSSNNAGTGGILQLASYMTGLSGGSWFISSLAVNDIPAIEDLVLGGNGYQGWFLEYSLLLPGGTFGLVGDYEYYQSIQMSVRLKGQAAFNTSATDAWAVALAYHFGPGGTTMNNFYDESRTEHNTNVQWGSIRDVSNFQGQGMPFPAIVADSRPPGYDPSGLALDDIYIPLNSTVYEFNPFEFGSWDPELAHFIDLDYVGTNLFNGQPYNSTGCVMGFSNFGFAMGTSSSLFNALIQAANTTLLGYGDGYGYAGKLLNGLLAYFSPGTRSSDVDVAKYPNPFYGINPGRFPFSNYEELELVDGGEAGANIPLDPLLVKARQVDIIIAIDGSADTDSYWPNATALRASYARAAALPEGQQILPYFPSAEDFINRGLNQRPVFFGCNASQSEVNNGMPMVIYLPNTPNNGSYLTNTSTFTPTYSRDDTQKFLDSIWTTQTRGYPQVGQSRDSNYGTCLACALVERRRQYQDMIQSSICQQCFSRYCYNAGPSTNRTALFAEVPNMVYNKDDEQHP